MLFHSSLFANLFQGVESQCFPIRAIKFNIYFKSCMYRSSTKQILKINFNFGLTIKEKREEGDNFEIGSINSNYSDSPKNRSRKQMFCTKQNIFNSMNTNS